MCGKLTSIHTFCYPDHCIRCAKKAELQEDIDAVVPLHYRGKAFVEKLPAKLQAVIENLDGDGLFLWGSVGAGKTHTMCSMARRYVEQGLNVKRVEFADLLLQIRETFEHKQPTVSCRDDSGRPYKRFSEGEEPSMSEQDVLNLYRQADRLFIEDIGTNKNVGSDESDFTVRILEGILNFRLENNLPTFITSNKSIKEIEESFDAKIASRIHGGCMIVEMSGRDRREEK